jgi:hypothetical protein
MDAIHPEQHFVEFIAEFIGWSYEEGITHAFPHIVYDYVLVA